MNEDQKKRIEEEKAALNKIRTSVKAGGGGPIKPLYGIPLPPKPLYAAPLYGIPI